MPEVRRDRGVLRGACPCGRVTGGAFVAGVRWRVAGALRRAVHLRTAGGGTAPVSGMRTCSGRTPVRAPACGPSPLVHRGHTLGTGRWRYVSAIAWVPGRVAPGVPRGGRSGEACLRPRGQPVPCARRAGPPVDVVQHRIATRRVLSPPQGRCGGSPPPYERHPGAALRGRRSRGRGTGRLRGPFPDAARGNLQGLSPGAAQGRTTGPGARADTSITSPNPAAHQGNSRGWRRPAACFAADAASLRCGVPRGRVGRAGGEGAGYGLRRTYS